MLFFTEDNVQEMKKLRGRVVKDVELVGDGIGINILTDDKPVYAVGCSVLLTNDKGELLLAKRKNNSGAGLLSTPGGRVEYNESVIDAGVREFAEECGATIVAPELLGWRKHNRYGNHYFMFYVHANCWMGEIKNLIPDKSEDWAWYGLDGLGSNNCTEPGDIIQILIDRGFLWSKIRFWGGPHLRGTIETNQQKASGGTHHEKHLQFHATQSKTLTHLR